MNFIDLPKCGNYYKFRFYEQILKFVGTQPFKKFLLIFLFQTHVKFGFFRKITVYCKPPFPKKLIL
ncbi:hypothetical protein C4X99_20850 [Leptospira interrogans serovar Geyaweera]|nr:hypothetical protein C5473_02300 [Leptospira interrogans serovar Weerasinghe]KAA1289293.1 hypothetical protein C4X99_20850 [Leptospira interrogans serovar Geyaweera]